MAQVDKFLEFQAAWHAPTATPVLTDRIIFGIQDSFAVHITELAVSNIFGV